MKKFENPEIETIVFQVENILTESSSGGLDDGYDPGEGGIGGGMGM